MLENSVIPKHLACIPGNWRTLDDANSAKQKLSALRVRYVPGYRFDGELDQPVVRVQVDDPKVQGLLDFMQTGDLYSSRTLLDEAHLHLYEKTNNPYAAAAAGYVFAKSGRPDDLMEWGRWIYNLASGFPALPDGQILLATLLLQGPQEARINVPGMNSLYGSNHRCALKAVLEAVRRGPPMFRMGLRLLLTNIQILQGLHSKDAYNSSMLDNMRAYVQDLNARVDKSQPFSVFDVGSDTL